MQPRYSNAPSAAQSAGGLDISGSMARVDLARLQRSHGAAGLTVATLCEAESYAAEGFGDILIAYPPGGESRFDRLVALGRGGA
jgi:D-serine deaminase-like pyridoxal phosphate-dependent protein